MTKKVLHFPERKDKLEDYNNQPCFSVLDEDDKFMLKVQKFRLKSRFAKNDSKEVYGSIVVDDEELAVFINDSSRLNKHYAVAKLSLVKAGEEAIGIHLCSYLDHMKPSKPAQWFHKYTLVNLTTNTPISPWDIEDV